MLVSFPSYISIHCSNILNPAKLLLDVMFSGHFGPSVSAVGKRDCSIIQEGEKLGLHLRTKTLATQGKSELLSFLLRSFQFMLYEVREVGKILLKVELTGFVAEWLCDM